MRYWELINEDELRALSAFIDKYSKNHVPLPAALARAVNRRNHLATSRFLAKAHARWAQLLMAAGRTHGPISANTRPLVAPYKPTAGVARYATSSGIGVKPAKSP